MHSTHGAPEHPLRPKVSLRIGDFVEWDDAHCPVRGGIRRAGTVLSIHRSSVELDILGTRDWRERSQMRNLLIVKQSNANPSVGEKDTSATVHKPVPRPIVLAKTPTLAERVKVTAHGSARSYLAAHLATNRRKGSPDDEYYLEFEGAGGSEWAYLFQKATGGRRVYSCNAIFARAYFKPCEPGVSL